MLKVRLMEAKHNFSRARSTAHDLGNLMHVVIHQNNVDSLTVLTSNDFWVIYHSAR